MGACSAKDKDEEGAQQSNMQPYNENNDYYKQEKQEQLKEVLLTNQDLVQERLGKITHDYTLQNPPLGKGAYGEVRKAVHKTSGMLRAIKIIPKNYKNHQDQQLLINEDHPNIIKIYEFYQDTKYFYIVSELCQGGELFDRIIDKKQFSEKDACDIIHQILLSVNYCHSIKIMHRDLKPENLLYDKEGNDGILKVIDFGTAKVYDIGQKFRQSLGTPYYIAPEVIKKSYDYKCDIWSCGVILYILLCGSPPFNGSNNDIIMKKVQEGKVRFNEEAWDNISTEAKDLIKKMLNLDVAKRYNAEQCLNHPWIKKYENKSNGSQKLQEGVYMFLVNTMTTREEKQDLLKTFKSLDTNNDGMLSRDELIEGYKQLMNAQQAEEEVDKLMAAVDRNQSGKIDYTEFVYATISRQNILSKQRLESAFKMFDKDGNGHLSREEMNELFSNNSKLDQKMWDDIMKQVDQNSDGLISLSEFKQMMFKLIDEV